MSAARTASPLALLAAMLMAGAACAADDPKPADFAWRGTLETPANASLVRVALPADALVRLQSSQANDVRVFDASGKPVPFAFAQPVGQPTPARQATASFGAVPMYSAQAGGKPPRGAMQVRVQDGSSQRSVWVQVAGTEAPTGDTGKLPSALFDTRASKQTISAITVKAALKPNAPTRVTLSASKDLTQWTHVPLNGSLYRFDGEGAPRNDTLELQEPLKLEGRYLRLDWYGQDGVSVESIAGLVAPATPPTPPVKAALPPPRADGASALEWELGFKTPIGTLQLVAQQQNVLVPVRVLGRSQAGEPWRQLGHTVVYRLNGSDGANINPTLALHSPAPRWLRVEATHGMRLEGIGLSAEVAFEPVDAVFVAGGSGPYQLAAGAKEIASAALPLSMIAGAVSGKIDTLPAAKVVKSESTAPAAPGAFAQMLPAGVDTRAAMLWGVLILGVLLLGGVAWSLMRNLGKTPPAA